MRSTAVTLMGFAVALSGGVARAGVIDGFEGGVNWTSNYTIINSGAGSGTITSSAVGTSAPSPFAGNELGNVDDASQWLASYIWDGSEQVSSGDTLSVMAYMDDTFWGGTTLIVKKFNSTDAYIVALWRYGTAPSNPVIGDLGFSVGVKDLTASIGGAPMRDWVSWGNRYLGGPEHTDALANTLLGSPASGWFKIEATYTEIGATNQIAVTVEDALGNPLGSATYTDNGTGAVAAQGAGDIGFGHQSWGATADVDNFAYVPEPATLGLLCVGALAVIRRRRR